MATVFAIPVQVGTPQSFNIRLGGVQYNMTLKYRNCDQGGWTLDITDMSGAQLLTGVPLVTGVDLLAQYPYLGFGGSLYVQTSSDPDAVPTFQNLGADGQIYWVTQNG